MKKAWMKKGPITTAICPSSHIWGAELLENLGTGVHSVTVRATDPYGQVSEASQVLEVEASDG